MSTSKKNQPKCYYLLRRSIFVVLVLIVFDRNNIPTIFASETQQGECTIGPDGACLSDTDVMGWLGTMNITTNEDGASMYDTGFGVAQSVVGVNAEDTKDRLVSIVKYMKNRVFAAKDDDILKEVAHECQLRHEHCAFWAVIGECEKNPAYMKLNCAPACYTCEHLSFDTRCPMPDNLENVWSAGDLNRMFERISTDGYINEKYKVEVLHRPINASDSSSGTRKDEPWVVVIDNFLTDEECDTLIQLGADEGYKQSLDVGAKKFDGTYDSLQSSGRTSTNAWCLNACFNNTVTKSVIEKIENLTGIPDANSEYFQLLKYEEHQFYQRHHDYIEHHVNRAQGVRILTVFLYLNDVEEGGGTNFPVLDTTVQAKRGRVLLWPSVKDENPSEKDPRTDHQALPVIKGIKYGANAWLHLRDFKTPYAANCI